MLHTSKIVVQITTISTIIGIFEDVLYSTATVL